MLWSGGQTQKWPTSGPGGYITPAVWEIPYALEWRTKSELPKAVPSGYITPAVGGVKSGPQVRRVAT